MTGKTWPKLTFNCFDELVGDVANLEQRVRVILVVFLKMETRQEHMIKVAKDARISPPNLAKTINKYGHDCNELLKDETHIYTS